LRAELKDTDVTVTCLMPGATDTEFFARADMLDTKVGAGKKDDPADVAKVGFDAMMKGEGDVVSGWKNKIQSAMANVTPSGLLAEQHRKMAEPAVRENERLRDRRAMASAAKRSVRSKKAVSNEQIAEFLAREAERSEGIAARAFKKAARCAFSGPSKPSISGKANVAHRVERHRPFIAERLLPWLKNRVARFNGPSDPARLPRPGRRFAMFESNPDWRETSSR